MIKNAGFTKVLALYERTDEAANMALELCEQLGLQYYACNGKFYNFVRPEINSKYFTQKFTVANEKYYLSTDTEQTTPVNPYDYLNTASDSHWKDQYAADIKSILTSYTTADLTSSAYAGHFASDEPSIAEMACIVEQVKVYAEVAKELSLNGECYVNLLPSYVTDGSRLSGTSDTTTTYEDYVKFYFENLAGLLGYVCYDHYALSKSGSGSTIKTSHLYDLAMMASYCRANNVELRAFVQSKFVSVPNVALNSSAELSWQIYSALAFGAKEISYFTYCGSAALFDYMTGATTTTYEWAKKINNDIASFGSAFMAYDWQGVMFYDEGTTSAQMQAVKNGSAGTAVTASSDMVKSAIVTSEEVSFVSTTDTILGVFATDAGDDAYLVANYDLTSSSTVTLTFANATSAIVYVNGEQTTVALENGVLTLDLGAGEGAFVVAQN